MQLFLYAQIILKCQCVCLCVCVQILNYLYNKYLYAHSLTELNSFYSNLMDEEFYFMQIKSTLVDQHVSYIKQVNFTLTLSL